MNQPHKVQSMFGFLALVGNVCSAGLLLASPSAAQETQDVEGTWGEWKPVPATVGADGHRTGSGECPLEIGRGQPLLVKWEAYGHAPPTALHRDEARTKPGGEWRPLSSLITPRNVHTRLELECGTAESTDVIPTVTDWKPLDLARDSEFEYCPEERPYLQNARCQTRTTLAVPTDEGGPDEEAPVDEEGVDEETPVDEEGAELPEDASELQALEVVDPSGNGVIADVIANGSGCPAGTWTAEVSEDGSTFSIAFADYQAQVEAGASFATEHCQLAIQFRDTAGKSYAVQALSFELQSRLAPGILGEFSSSYYFQGSPGENSFASSSTFSGPSAETYVFDESYALEQLEWSACGENYDLNISTRLTIRNDTAAYGPSWLRMNGANGAGRLVAQVVARDC
jgi:Domain of unknown function (DUF4360)